MTGEPPGPDGRADLLVGEPLRTALEGRLALLFGQSVRVEGLERLTGGASRETWAFDAVAGGVRRALVLRRCHAGARGASLLLEGRVIGAAGAAGVPVPEILHATDDPTEQGGPYLVASRVGGETIARRVHRLLDTVAGGRGRVARGCAVALARLHTVAPAAVCGLPPAEDPVSAHRQAIDDLGVVSPAFELALRWLDDHRPATGDSAVVHGDFRMGNLVIDAGGLAAVLDWELVHTGDPLEDLGWFCARPWRFGADAALEAGGLAPIEEWVRAYEAEAGRAVDRGALRWWVTMANLNWGIICALQAERHLSGAEPSAELAAIGRRRSETEWDLLECLPRRRLAGQNVTRP